MSRAGAALFGVVAVALAALWWVSRGEHVPHDVAPRPLDVASRTELLEAEAPTRAVATAPESAPRAETLALATTPAPLDADPDARLADLHVTVLRRAPGAPPGSPDVAYGGASVRAWAVGGVLDGNEVFDEAVTDSDGRARLALPWSELAQLRRTHAAARIRVTANAPQFHEVTQLVRLPASFPDDGLELTFRVLPTLVIEGRIEDAEGRPIAGTVWLHNEGFGWGSNSSTQVDAGDPFRFQVAVPCRVVVRAAGRARGTAAAIPGSRARVHDLGTAVSPPIEIAFGDPAPEPLMLRVSGDHVLRGLLLDARDVPVPGVLVHAALPRVVAAEHPRPTGIALPPATPDAMPTGGGNDEAWALTDAEGRFVVRGLRPERYVLRAATGQLPGRRGSELLAPQAEPADGVERVYRLEHCGVIVRLVRPDGAPFTGAIRVWDDAPTDPRASTAFPVAPALRVLADPGVGGRRYPFRTERLDRSVRALGDGVFSMQALPGDGFLVGVFARRRAWRPERVRVPDAGGAATLTLVVPEEQEPGWIDLTFRGADGAALHEVALVTVASEADDTLLLGQQVSPGSSEEVLSLPAAVGRYRVSVVALGPPGDGRMAGGAEVPSQGAASTVLDVLPGQGTRWDVVLDAPARLRLTLRGEPDDADRLMAGRSRREDDPAVREAAARFVRLELRRPGHPRIMLRVHPDASLGGRVTSAPLVPGPATLIATLPGGRQLMREVELEAGVISELEVDFE